jgi:alkylhydroperoxidase family enzyme
MSRFPLVAFDAPTLRHIQERGGRPMNLYRVLGNHPALLHAWVDFASVLRYQCGTSRALRELIVLRIAQVCHSAYQWRQHLALALQAGVPQDRIDGLAEWRTSSLFEAPDRAALALAEGIAACSVDPADHAQASTHFSQPEMLEIILTASFYTMCSRVLDATAVTSEGEADLQA